MRRLVVALALAGSLAFGGAATAEPGYHAWDPVKRPASNRHGGIIHCCG